MHDKSLNYIYNLERFGKEFTLDNITKFLKLVDNPENDLKLIHVAGTNGKGSVCSLMQKALMEKGYKVGLFTSPHLTKLNERIKVDGELISDEELDELIEKVKEIYEKNNFSLTFFETITAMAFMYFKKKEVDYVVMETGLGGRLDATNVCKPILTVITSISFDHEDTLGNTIEEIAGEKAGIIKKRIKVVTDNSGEALEVIKSKGEEVIIPEKKEYETYWDQNKALAKNHYGVESDEALVGISTTSDMLTYWTFLYSQLTYREVKKAKKGMQKAKNKLRYLMKKTAKTLFDFSGIFIFITSTYTVARPLLQYYMQKKGIDNNLHKRQHKTFQSSQSKTNTVLSGREEK